LSAFGRSVGRLSGINLLLVRRVALLKNHVATIRSESRLNAGDKVPLITAKDPQGRSAVFDYRADKLPTVVFVITPACKWCTQNIMNMRTLVAKAGDRFKFVGFSLSSNNLYDYVTQNKLDFPMYTDFPLIPTNDYKLGGTPQTIVVSPTGEVLKVWTGAFAEETQKEVEEYFGVSLPGLMDPEKAADE
jgi:peroxiredoxin